MSSFVVRATIVSRKVFGNPVVKIKTSLEYVYVKINFRFQRLLAQTRFIFPSWTDIPEASLIQGRYPTAVFLDDNNIYKLC